LWVLGSCTGRRNTAAHPQGSHASGVSALGSDFAALRSSVPFAVAHQNRHGIVVKPARRQTTRSLV